MLPEGCDGPGLPSCPANEAWFKEEPALYCVWFGWNGLDSKTKNALVLYLNHSGGSPAPKENRHDN
jgi:hypothetical protein